MEDHIKKEIRKLKRERKEIDASIADFELIEDRLPVKDKPSGTTSSVESGVPIPINRRRSSDNS